jgi:pyruvate,water dikinase
MKASNSERLVIPFAQLDIADVPLVGGKNASLGEMVQHLSHVFH